MDLLVAFLALLARFMDSGPGLPDVFLYLLVAGLPLTLLHELGHGVVARRRLGSEVHVVVGTSGRLADLRLFGVSVSLNALADPKRVGGYAEFDPSSATLRDIGLIALGGPAASFAGFVVCVVGLSLAPPAGVTHDALWALTLGGAFAWGLNLIPMTVREGRDGPSFRSDGRVALDAFRAMAPRRGAATPPAAAGHLPLRGRRGAPLGVEPMTRTSVPDIADDGVARRARRLSANRGQSIPPPSC